MEICSQCGEEKSVEGFPPRKGAGVMQKKRRCTLCLKIHRRAKGRIYDAKESRKGRTGPRMRMVRTTLIAAYGGCCACCGEDIYEFLAIDHINNDGAEERRELHQTSILNRLYRELPSLDARYQILCHNCNVAKANWGACPHTAQHGRA